MKNSEKWINEYIKDIDLKNIEWIKLNSTELYRFFEENYFDQELWEYVRDKDANSVFPTLLGMHYLNFHSPINGKDYIFLLGVINNNIGKKTIVSSIVYLDEYFIFANQKEPLTYISTIEVNSFFRNMGLCKKSCEMFLKFVNPNQHILMSRQSEMGKKCKVHEILIKSALKKDFKEYILEDNYHLCDSKFYEMICSKPKTLKK